MAPADFSHQWREFFQAGVRLKKSFHPPEVGDQKAAHAWKLRPQIGGELFHHHLASALGLLPLHDQPADVPVQADQFLVDRFEGFILGGADALLDLGEQARVLLRLAEAFFTVLSVGCIQISRSGVSWSSDRKARSSVRVNASGLREMAVRLKKMAPIFLAACGHSIA